MMTSNRPYLIRALYEWILDNDGIPHLLVNAEDKSILVPKEFVEEGKIILDISPEAVRDLIINNEYIEFRGRFGEAIQHVSFPTDFVLAIYNEQGIGMFFEEASFLEGMEEESEEEEVKPAFPPKKTTLEKSKKKKDKKPHPHLRIIK